MTSASTTSTFSQTTSTPISVTDERCFSLPVRLPLHGAKGVLAFQSPSSSAAASCRALCAADLAELVTDVRRDFRRAVELHFTQNCIGCKACKVVLDMLRRQFGTVDLVFLIRVTRTADRAYADDSIALLCDAERCARFIAAVEEDAVRCAAHVMRNMLNISDEGVRELLRCVVEDGAQSGPRIAPVPWFDGQNGEDDVLLSACVLNAYNPYCVFRRAADGATRATAFRASLSVSEDEFRVLEEWSAETQKARCDHVRVCLVGDRVPRCGSALCDVFVSVVFGQSSDTVFGMTDGRLALCDFGAYVRHPSAFAHGGQNGDEAPCVRQFRKAVSACGDLAGRLTGVVPAKCVTFAHSADGLHIRFTLRCSAGYDARRCFLSDFSAGIGNAVRAFFGCNVFAVVPLSMALRPCELMGVRHAVGSPSSARGGAAAAAARSYTELGVGDVRVLRGCKMSRVGENIEGDSDAQLYDIFWHRIPYAKYAKMRFPCVKGVLRMNDEFASVVKTRGYVV